MCARNELSEGLVRRSRPRSSSILRALFPLGLPPRKLVGRLFRCSVGFLCFDAHADPLPARVHVPSVPGSHRPDCNHQNISQVLCHQPVLRKRRHRVFVRKTMTHPSGARLLTTELPTNEFSGHILGHPRFCSRPNRTQGWAKTAKALVFDRGKQYFSDFGPRPSDATAGAHRRQYCLRKARWAWFTTQC